jgi:endonuclease YncB( thermonuclease family)
MALCASSAWPAAAADDRDPAPDCTGLVAGPTHTVTRVLDTETVALDDGSELRLIGALAPRALDAGAEPGRWPLEIAAEAELRALVLGRTVELAFAGQRSDRYGRLLAHAFVRAGSERRWVQGHLIEQGLARAYAADRERACAEALLAREWGPRAAGRGLWGEAAYQVRQAGQAAALALLTSTFQVVEGRVSRAAQVRGTIYLDFDAARRPSFSVSLRRADRGLLGAHADNLRALEGRRVRVRGWIMLRRSAPAIDLSAGGLIEVLDGDAAPRTQPPGPMEAGR